MAEPTVEESTEDTATGSGESAEGEDSVEREEADAGDDASTASSGSSSTATIAFDTGDTLSTEVACWLETQESAGQEILYTATSLSNPYFDLTVFGENSDFTGVTVSWNDTEDFVTYQEAWSTEGPLGENDFTYEVNGSTITGSGTFYRTNDDPAGAGESRQGTVEVDCS